MTNLTTGLIVSAVVFVPLVVMVYHAAKAPEGYQDDVFTMANHLNTATMTETAHDN